STLFKLRTGQLKPTAGTIHFKGVDVARLQPHEIARAGIGIKFQVPRVYDGLSVAENLWLSARFRHGVAGAGAIVDRVLAEIGLVERRASLAGHLSHGDRQWVEIGMVLTSDPDLVLLEIYLGERPRVRSGRAPRAVRAGAGAERCLTPGGGGRARRDHRTERRGQDDPAARAHGLPPRPPGAHPLARGRSHAPAALP